VPGWRGSAAPQCPPDPGRTRGRCSRRRGSIIQNRCGENTRTALGCWGAAGGGGGQPPRRAPRPRPRLQLRAPPPPPRTRGPMGGEAVRAGVLGTTWMGGRGTHRGVRFPAQLGRPSVHLGPLRFLPGVAWGFPWSPVLASLGGLSRPDLPKWGERVPSGGGRGCRGAPTSRAGRSRARVGWGCGDPSGGAGWVD
jgi:hypothetical protein